MPGSELNFNITALDNASKTFVKMAEQVERLSKKVDKLDGKDATVKVEADTAKAQSRLDRFFDRAAAKAQRNGVLLSKAMLTPLGVGLAGLPVAAGAAAAATAGALAAVPLAFAGIGAAAVASSEDVKSAYSSLAAHVVASTREMAAPLESTLIGIADKVRNTFDGVSGDLRTLFASASKPLNELTDGVLNMAINALPGMTRAAQNSMDAMRGWSALLAQVGGGVSDMLTAMSQTGPAATRALTELGGIMRDLLGFVGELGRNLTRVAGPVLEQFRNVLHQVYEILLNLTSNGFPALSGAVRGFTDVISALLTAINGITSALGGWAAPLTYALGAFKALDMISLGRLKGSFSGLLGKMRSASGLVGKLKAGLKGGWVGLAVTGALSIVTLALNEMSREQRIVREGLENLRNVQERYNAALKKTSGILTEISRKEILGGPEAKKAAENVRILGLNYERFVEGVTQGTPEANAMYGALEQKTQQLLNTSGLLPGTANAIARSFRELRVNGQGAEGVMEEIRLATQAYKTKLVETGVVTSQHTDKANRLAAAFKSQLIRVADLNTQYGSLVGAADKLTRSQVVASEKIRALSESEWAARISSARLGEAFTVLADTTSSAKQQVSALKTALDILAGRTPGLEESMKSFNDLIRGMVKQFKGMNIAAVAANGNLLKASGAINTTTAAGSKLWEVLDKSQTNMIQVANAMRNAGKPTEAITKRLTTMRDRLREQLTALGLTPAQIQKVLDKYGLMPNQVVTSVLLKGDKQAMTQIQNVFNKLNGLPDSTPVEVKALTIPARNALISLGYKIVRLPDGTFKVFSNTKPGRKAAKDFINDYDGARMVTQVDADTSQAEAAVKQFMRRYGNLKQPFGASPGLAMGGIIKAFAGGGFQPMAAGQAKMVPPNTWRIIGDRAKDDEAYIPINDSSRSRSLLGEAARRMGFGLAPMAGGGLLSAAAELLSRIRGGGSIFEDFSFRGSSSNLGRFNDKLADMFYGSHQGFDFGPSGTLPKISGWLNNLLTGGSSRGSTKGILSPERLRELSQASEELTRSVQTLNTDGLTPMAQDTNNLSTPALLRLRAAANLLGVDTRILAHTLAQQWGLITQRVQGAHRDMSSSQVRLQTVEAASWAAITRTVSRAHTRMGVSQTQLQTHMGASWTGITSSVQSNVTRENAAFGTLERGMRQVRRAMTATAGWAEREFRRMYEAAADPTRKVLRGPFNRGIIAAWNKLDRQFSFDQHVSKVAIPFARGTEDHRAQIAPAGAMRLWAEPETGGEAYIPLGGSKRRRSTDILGSVAERFGYGLMPMANGGLIQQMSAMVRNLFPSAQVTSTLRPGDPGLHGSGNAIDFVTRNMFRAGQVMARRFPNSLELIHNPGASIDSGRRVPPSFWGPATWAGHRDHIHWAMRGLQGGRGASVALDPRAMVADAFADAQSMLARFRNAFSGNQMGRTDAGVASEALTGVKGAATSKLKDMFSGIGAGGGNAANMALGRAMAAAMGWTGAQWQALKQLWINESGWRTFATNPSSGAYGIPQSLPASKMASAGADWRTNPATQVKWGMGYIDDRYGNPMNAWNAWQSRSPHWYGKGMSPTVFRKPTLIGVGESGPELVSVTPMGGGSNQAPTNIDVKVYVGGREITDMVDTRIEVHERDSQRKIRAGRR